jgi:hypothetical protein
MQSSSFRRFLFYAIGWTGIGRIGIVDIDLDRAIAPFGPHNYQALHGGVPDWTQPPLAGNFMIRADLELYTPTAPTGAGGVLIAIGAGVAAAAGGVAFALSSRPDQKRRQIPSTWAASSGFLGTLEEGLQLDSSSVKVLLQFEVMLVSAFPL